MAFCAENSWKMSAFPAEELAVVEGIFSASDFVASVTGVDNVCERAALLAAGAGGELLVRKYAGDGITFALAQIPVKMDL